MLERVDRYLQLVRELDVRLVKAVDTHLHAITSPASARCAAGPGWRWSICARKPDATSTGIIPGSLHSPFTDLQANVSAGGMLHELAAPTGKRIVFYCAYGERLAMAVQAEQAAGLASACHIEGGIAVWKNADGPLAR